MMTPLQNIEELAPRALQKAYEEARELREKIIKLLKKKFGNSVWRARELGYLSFYSIPLGSEDDEILAKYPIKKFNPWKNVEILKQCSAFHGFMGSTLDWEKDTEGIIFSDLPGELSLLLFFRQFFEDLKKTLNESFF